MSAGELSVTDQVYRSGLHRKGLRKDINCDCVYVGMISVLSVNEIIK